MKRIEKSRFEPLLETLDAIDASEQGGRDVTRWSKGLHWSFPESDRAALNWLWHAARRASAPDLLPEALWLHVFSYVTRGWWASRELFPNGRPLTNVLAINIVKDNVHLES